MIVWATAALAFFGRSVIFTPAPELWGIVVVASVLWGVTLALAFFSSVYTFKSKLRGRALTVIILQFFCLCGIGSQYSGNRSMWPGGLAGSKFLVTVVVLVECLLAVALLKVYVYNRKTHSHRLYGDHGKPLAGSNLLQHVFAVIVFALIAALGVADILGVWIIRGAPRGLVIYASACSLISAIFLCYVVGRDLRQRHDRDFRPPTSTDGGHQDRPTE